MSQDQLLHAQKMDSLARLVGGVAHDFNNMLTVIINFTHLAAERVADDEVCKGYLREIHDTADRAARLAGQLLTFSSPQVIKPTVVSLNDIIIDSSKMLRRLIGEHIEFVTLMESELALVEVDPNQIEQILINLVVNARDAMPEGGKLVVETANVDFGQHFTDRYPEITRGEYVTMSVGDSGVGMTQDVQVKAFEPFFTTKKGGASIGLGLSICSKIVAQSGGHIEVQSHSGNGTTITVYLPVSGKTPHTLPSTVGIGPLPVGSETILLVEDEPSVRNITAAMLRGQGYDVVEASNGTEAVRLATERTGTCLHLLLTDVVMPLMGGLELAERVKDAHPEAKVLYMSGYNDETMIRRNWTRGPAGFLQKPFTPGILARSVREILDGSGALIP